MCYTEEQKISYDTKFDVLYYTFGNPSNSYGDEISSHIIVMRDIETEEPQGFTVLDFKKICEKKNSEYDELCKLFSVDQVLKSI
ncbi:MAG: hypothetical protein NC121_18080 [Blautia sp.]|nr:hypothetical protein [Blautia sp.]